MPLVTTLMVKMVYVVGRGCVRDWTHIDKGSIRVQTNGQMDRQTDRQTDRWMMGE